MKLNSISFGQAQTSVSAKRVYAEVWTDKCSQPTVGGFFESTFQKGDMFVLSDKKNNISKKIPMANIFQVNETYSPVNDVEKPSWSVKV